MIVKLSLYLTTAALAGFLLAAVIGHFLFIGLAEHAANIASLLLLSAFFLLMLTGLIQMGKLIFASVFNFFSRQQRCERERMYHLNQYNRLNRLFQFKKDRVVYENQQQRKRLLRQYN